MSGSTSTGTIIGSGSDSITLNMAEDQQAGVDAQFSVNVDGQQIGGAQTVTASQSAGQTQPFTFEGNWGPGPHVVTVSFPNNFSYPGTPGDRNVYVDGVTYDGNTVSDKTTGIYQTPLFPPNSTTGNNWGNAVFSINDTTPIPSGASSTPTTTPSPVSVGSGSDTLVLNMAEDAYQGDAQFTVSVDGKQVGGTQTTTASVDQGQFQEFDVHGNFGSGSHQVTVDFTNDKIGAFYPGTQDAIDTTDRNLYVMGTSLDGGTPASGAPWELSSGGPENFTVTAGSNPSATAFNSGLFATDGAAATSDNAAIPSGSLASSGSTTGSSSGMSFIASPTTSASDTSSSGSASGGSASSGSATGGPASSASGSDGSGSGSGGAGSTLTDTTNQPSPSTAASSTDSTPSLAGTMTAATQSPQDFNVPAASTTSGGDTSSGTSGSGQNWWQTSDTTGAAGSGSQHNANVTST